MLKADEGESQKEAKLLKDEAAKADKAAREKSHAEESKMQAVLENGDKVKEERAEQQVKAVLDKKDVTSESDYQSTVQAAMEADLRRRAAERKMREQFRAKRAKKLAQDDSSNTAKIEASMESVSKAIMQPDQLVNVARAKQIDGTVCLSPDNPAVGRPCRTMRVCVHSQLLLSFSGSSVCASLLSLPCSRKHLRRQSFAGDGKPHHQGP